MKAKVSKAFADLYRTMVVALQPRGLEADTMAVYFDDLQDFTIDELAAAARRLRQRQPKGIWPTTAEWYQAADEVRRQTQTGNPTDLRVMDPSEVIEHRRAHRLLCVDEPCGCLVCRAAGVTALPLRFVPDVTEDGEPIRAFNQARKKAEHLGHWAHGDELARYYLAYDHFVATVRALPPSSDLRRAAVQLAPSAAHEREPGEEG